VDSAVITSLIAVLGTKQAFEAIRTALSEVLARRQIRLKAADPESLAAELAERAASVRGDETPEESSRTTRQVIEKALSVVERERNRLTPIAAREHWIALVFAVVAGAIFLGTIVLAVRGSVTQALVTLAASTIPGFLSAVFFSREAKLETRLTQITADIWESEKAKQRLELLEEALKIVPPESRGKLADAFSKKLP
jgi:uncharacterized protein (DUF2267 family)